MTEPIRELLGQDSKEWTVAASQAVKNVASYLVKSSRWLNMAPDQEARLESRVTTKGLAVLLL